MLGFKFVKAQPTTYVLQYSKGKVVREGLGLSFFHFTPNSSLVAVPVDSRSEGFIYSHVTADFQTVTVQGQVTYRIGEPRRAAALLNLTLRPDGTGYETEDVDQIPQRVLRTVEVLTQQAVKELPLKAALLASDRLAARVAGELGGHSEIAALGIEVLGLAIVAVKPTPETARALEAEARERILGAADEAIFARRNAAVANERAIKESELDTEIAVEQKKRAIRETQLEAEASLRKRQQEIRAADMAADIELEETRKQFVVRNAENTRTLAEADAHRVAAVMEALRTADPRVVQALAATGMQPGQLIAQAFGGIAERAERIGQLNVSPDLLQGLLAAPTPAAVGSERTGRASSGGR